MKDFKLKKEEFYREVSILFPLGDTETQMSIIESFKEYHEKLGYIMGEYEVEINLEENIGILKMTLIKMKILNCQKVKER